MSVTVPDALTVAVKTPRLQAVFKGARLVSLTDPDGRPLVARDPGAGPAGLDVMFFAEKKSVPLGTGTAVGTYARGISPTVAHIHVEDDEGDACLRISVDSAGRLLVEPSAQTLRSGLGLIRFNLAGIAPGLKLVAPFFQGCRQDLEHPLVAGRWRWPNFWESALAILQGNGGGFSVCCHDARSLPKTLYVGHVDDARMLRFATECTGPWDRNTAVGGIAWVLDTHRGGWQVAAAPYRQWLWETFGLESLKCRRPDWVKDVRLAVSWCNAPVLDALEKVLPARKILLHVPAWRTDKYDINYPEYNPSPEGEAFIREAVRRGFRVLPHFNALAVDPVHPFFGRVRDLVVRDLYSKRLEGWRWKNQNVAPFPQSTQSVIARRSDNTMAYVHSGSSTWRRELVWRVAEVLKKLETGGVFVDQTLCTWNCDNGLVENISTSEGMVALTRELSELEGPPAIAGEGRNEMCMQYLSFAQAHLFTSWHKNCDKFEELDPVPIDELLYGELCKTIGYTNLAGDDPDSNLRIETHHRLGALPTLCGITPEQIENPTPGVRRILERATELGS